MTETRPQQHYMKSPASQVAGKHCVAFVFCMRIWLFLVLTTTSLSYDAQASDAIPALTLTPAISSKHIDRFIHYFADEDGKFTPNELFTRAEQFTPISEISIYKSVHTHWYWLRLHNPEATPVQWYMTTGISTPPLLRGYWQSETHPHRLDHNHYDLHIPSRRAHQYPLLAFPIELKPGETGNLLIEYRSIANFPLEIRPYTNDSLIIRSQYFLHINGIYMGATFVFFLFFAAQFLAQPNRTHLYYLLFVVSIILTMLQVSGFRTGGSIPEDGQHNSLFTAVVGGSIYIWYFLFSTEFLELKKYNIKLHRVLKGLSLAVFAFLLIGIFTPVDYILSVVMVVGLPWPIVAAAWSVRQKFPSAKFLLVGSTVHCLTTYLLMAGCLGIETPFNELFFPIASAGLMFDIFCFAIAIMYQTNQLHTQYNRQLQERIDDLNSLAESEQVSAKALSMSKQAVLNTAATAHDLQQPLSSMQLMISLQDQQDPIVKQTKEALDYARALLNSALNSSKENYQSIRENINPRPLLDTALQRHQAKFNQKGLQVHLFCPDSEIVCLPLVINRILDNILTNACKYTNTGKILVSGRKRKNGEFLLQIWDTGQGMSPSQVKKILTPFERLHKNNSDHLGFGLGLFIVKSLCNQAGYQLQVRSTEGHGSCFTIVLPTNEQDTTNTH